MQLTNEKYFLKKAFLHKLIYKKKIIDFIEIFFNGNFLTKFDEWPSKVRGLKWISLKTYRVQFVF